MTLLKKPRLWIISSIIYLWVFTAAKLFVTVGPPLVMYTIVYGHRAFSLTKLNNTFLFYIEDLTKRLGMSYEYVFYSFLANAIFFLSALLIGAFVLKKKRWARNALIALLVMLILWPLIMPIAFGYNINILKINFLIFPGMIYLLKRKDVEPSFT